MLEMMAMRLTCAETGALLITSMSFTLGSRIKKCWLIKEFYYLSQLPSFMLGGILSKKAMI